MKRNNFVLILLMLLVPMISCEKDDKKDELPSYIALDKDLLGDQMDFAILGKDGIGYFYELQDEHPIPQRISIYNGNKNEVELVINFDEVGFPKNILSEDFTIVLGNYVENRFDAVIITKDGESQLIENIEIDVTGIVAQTSTKGTFDVVVFFEELGKGLRELATNNYNDCVRAIKEFINPVVKVVACPLSVAGAVIMPLTTPLALINCTSAFATLGELGGWWETPQWIDDADRMSNYAGLALCAVKPDWDCLVTLLDYILTNGANWGSFALEDIRLGEGVLMTGSGNVQITLIWDNYADIDLHCIDPAGAHIYFANKYSYSTGGFLDYDNVVAYGPENIYFTPAPAGTYRVYLHYYAENRGISSVNYKVAIFQNNSGQVYEGTISGLGTYVDIATFTIEASNKSSEIIKSSELVIDWNNLPAKTR